MSKNTHTITPGKKELDEVRELADSAQEIIRNLERHCDMNKRRILKSVCILIGISLDN